MTSTVPTVVATSRAMPGLGPPPHHLVGAGHLPEPCFGGGARVELVLHQLPLQFPPGRR